MSRSTGIWGVVGLGLAVGAFLFFQKAEEKGDIAPLVEAVGVTTAVVEGFDAAAEGRATQIDSLLHRLEEAGPTGSVEASEWAAILAELRRQHGEIMRVEKEINARVLLLVCQPDNVPNYRDCRRADL